jgi:hypothetical protein
MARILRKKLLEKRFLNFKKWVESIQTASYNGGSTVVVFSIITRDATTIYFHCVLFLIVQVSFFNKTSCPKIGLLCYFLKPN